MQCPLCFKEKNEPYFCDKVRAYHHCLVCDLVFVPPTFFLAEKEEKARYDLHQNNGDDEGYKQFLLQLLTPMLCYLKPEDEGLDFGSGPVPVLANLFSSYNFKVEKYDPFYANNTAVLNRQYNFITACEVVEHLYSPREEFDQLIELLCTNGVFGLMTKTVPTTDSFSNWWYKNDATHVCFYSETTFRWMAEKWDLNIEYCKGDVVIFRKK